METDKMKLNTTFSIHHTFIKCEILNQSEICFVILYELNCLSRVEAAFIGLVPRTYHKRNNRRRWAVYVLIVCFWFYLQKIFSKVYLKLIRSISCPKISTWYDYLRLLKPHRSSTSTFEWLYGHTVDFVLHHLHWKHILKGIFQ